MTNTAEPEYRTEHDTMGEVRVPAPALYRAQTQRAVENFPISGVGLERAHVVALARVKKAAAQVNADLGVLERPVADAIAAAATRSSREPRTAPSTPSSPSTCSRPGPARAAT